jgi:plastocyanin
MKLKMGHPKRASLFVAFAILILVRPVLAGTVEGRVLPAAVAARSQFVISVEDIQGIFPAPKEVAVIDQKDLRFVPHVLAVQAGASVEFPNSDPVSHNVFSISPAKRFNLGLYVRGAKRRITFDHPGVVELLCNVHLEMSGYIVVLKNPYFSRASSDGTYRITAVPAGRYRLRCWNEALPAQERTVLVPQAGPVTVDFPMGERGR